MDPLTHILFGACLSRAGFNRTTALATPLMALAAEIPDMDMVVWIGSSVKGFAAHRGITHSIVGIPFDAALAVLVIYGAHRAGQWWKTRQSKSLPEARSLGSTDKIPVPKPPPPRWSVLFLLGCVAALSHLLLDFTNAYGLRPLIPFSYHWYHWDIVSIIEPVLSGALIVGLVLPSLFRLIQEEIGARRGQPGKAGARVALAIVLLVWGLRDYQHRRAVAALNSLEYGSQLPLRLSAFPYMTNPFRWHGVVETDTLDRVMDVETLAPAVDPERRERAYYRQDSPIIEAAKRSLLGRVYMDWADYPVFQVIPLAPGEDPGPRLLRRMAYRSAQQGEPEEPSPGGYLVRIIDLRYAYPGRISLSPAVQLDKNLQVVATYFGGRRERPGN
jgi:inner membrane protein